MSLPRPAVVVAGACTALALALGAVASPAQAADLRPASLWIAAAPVPPTAANPFPGVAFITPAPSKTKLAYNTQVQVTFTAPVTTVNTSTFFVTDGRGARVAGTVFQAPVYGSGGRENTWVFSASNGFPRNAQLTVHLQGITAASGSKLPTATWAFSTGTSFQYGGLY